MELIFCRTSLADGYRKGNLNFNAELWMSAYLYPCEKIKLVLNKKS